MMVHEITLSHTELRIVNRDWNGRVICETDGGLPVFVYNPSYEPSGPGADRVRVPVDDVLADKLRETGSGWYTPAGDEYDFLIRLRG